ncbi:MAG: PASTA domain-containing protein [Trueperaceae bacterium]|nr:PASTA domain-containing protein [Truepera sp.]HRN18743.1 PASTA domain-containing protein [Trueperaceae bacterium]HRQ09790.1 PASTA domain-containing protein [Trueperaceae bacterium]
MSTASATTNPAPSRRAWGWLLVSGLVLLVLAAFVVLDASRYFAVGEEVLPDLVGMQYEAATKVLRSHGFEPVAFVEHVEGVAAGTVTSQSPQAGAIVKRLRSIHLGVNTPPAAAVLPDLSGMTERTAVARASELNLPLGTTEYQHSDRTAGTVIGQAPAGGQRLAEGGTLSLVVSSGPERAAVELPDLLGTDLDAAVQQLQRLGFGRVETLASSVSFDRPRAVVAMEPPAGAAVPPGTPVLLHYSLSTATAIQVPDVVGMPQWRAQLALTAAQLRVGTVTYVTDPEQPEGVIAAQPDGYTVPGTPVFLTVNGAPPANAFPDLFPTGPQTGPDLRTPVRPSPAPGGADSAADGSRLVPFTFDPTNMGVKRLLDRPYQLKLVVTDDEGERVVLDRRVGAGQSVTTSVLVHGQEAMLQTFIDDVFFQAWRP